VIGVALGQIGMAPGAGSLAGRPPVRTSHLEAGGAQTDPGMQ
jgi:hypothetical protein